MKTEIKEERYIPAMGYHWLTPLYDPLTRFMGMSRVRKRLLLSSKISAGQNVLDVGCGTGRLLEMVKKAEPNADLF